MLIHLLFNLNLELIIYSEVRTIDTETGSESQFYVDEFKTDHEKNLESKVTCNKLLLPSPWSAKQCVLVLPSPCSAEYYVLEDMASIMEFDIMHSSLPFDPISATVD